MAFLGHEGDGVMDHPIDAGAVGKLLGGMEKRFFEITSLTNGSNNRERHGILSSSVVTQ
jgi:hypothetical protein